MSCCRADEGEGGGGGDTLGGGPVIWLLLWPEPSGVEFVFAGAWSRELVFCGKVELLLSRRERKAMSIGLS